jgi:DNA-binding response OmpR family regulator
LKRARILIAMMNRRAILLVEDETSISEPLAAALEGAGFDVTVAATAAGGLEEFNSRQPDLVLLDVMLPDGSGFDVCRELRKTSQVPIIMLTARGEEADRIVGLELGADDYVVKPFSAREVVARIRAVLRRTEAAPGTAIDGPIEVGEVRLRKKLGDDSSEPRYLHTVRGVGFRFASPEEAGREST